MGFQETFNERVIPAGNRAFGIAATLTQGPRTSESFTATWESREYESEDAEGFTTKYHSRDFMFAKTDCKIGEELITPRRGDVLEITEAGEVKRFEIMPPGVPAVEEMDGHYRWRVHTKQVQ